MERPGFGPDDRRPTDYASNHFVSKSDIEVELLELLDRMIDHRATDVDLARIEQLAMGDSRLMTLYVDYVSLHAALGAERGAPARRDHEGRALSAYAPDRSVLKTYGTLSDNVSTPAPIMDTNPPRYTSHWMVAAVLASSGFSCLLMALAMGWFSTPRPVIATLTQVQGCKWDGGSLPTELGAQLTAGRMRLAEGLATITFVNGVKINLEGPAELDLVTPMRCVMTSGRLVAEVPPAGKGFVVETPTSVLTDFGTEFGVAVNPGKESLIQVFKGRVDATHRESGKTEKLFEGSTFEFKEAGYRRLGSSIENRMQAAQPPALADTSVSISTSQGRGRDAFVQPNHIPEDRRSESLLLVKRPFLDFDGWERRAYLGFDLSGLRMARVQSAELTLTIAPTGFGFAARVPNATFDLYGMTDEALDDWDERELTWENAPANREQPQSLDPSKSMWLGSFVIPQGEQSSSFTIRGEKLTDFVNSDKNGLLTLIVVRQTAGIGPSDLVHGIVSRRHPTLTPPTLRLVVDPYTSE